MTTAQRAVYHVFSTCVALLAAYAVSSLLAAVQFLPPPVLNGWIDASHIGPFSRVCLALALPGLAVAAGWHMVLAERIAHTTDDAAWWWRLARAWRVLAWLVVAAGALGQLEGRYALEVPVVLDVVMGVWLVLGFAVVALNVQAWSPGWLVYGLGMAVVVVCHVLGIAALAHPVQDRVLRVAAVNAQLLVGLLLVAVAVCFWLMRRFSNVRQPWADQGAASVGGLMVVAGALLSIIPLAGLGLSGGLALLGAVWAPLACVVYAAHAYRALSDHNAAQTLASHYVALHVVLVLAVGALGSALLLPDVAALAQGTRLPEAHYSLAQWAVLAALLGMVNQAASEMRQSSQRVTGLTPFWLLSAGAVLAGITLLAAGAAQVLLERRLNVGYLDTQTLLAPLYLGWIVGVAGLALGLCLYALGYRARQIRG
jgi:hypothetical protein